MKLIDRISELCMARNATFAGHSSSAFRHFTEIRVTELVRSEDLFGMGQETAHVQSHSRQQAVLNSSKR